MPRTDTPYTIIVANVGTVYSGSDPRAAQREYRAWVKTVRAGDTRAPTYGPVTLTGPDGSTMLEYVGKPKLPTVRDVSAVVKAIKRAGIGDDYRAFEEDDGPGVQLTVGWSPETGEWSYQTGDNSYSGGAYFYPVWGVAGVYRRSNARDVARDILGQLQEQFWSGL